MSTNTTAIDMELCDIANREPMTASQRKYFNAILMLTEKAGLPPTMKELVAFLGISSPNAAYEQIRRLKRKGYLENSHMQARALIVKR